jgi:hypothetical protein
MVNQTTPEWLFRRLGFYTAYRPLEGQFDSLSTAFLVTTPHACRQLQKGKSLCNALRGFRMGGTTILDAKGTFTTS